MRREEKEDEDIEGTYSPILLVIQLVEYEVTDCFMLCGMDRKGEGGDRGEVGRGKKRRRRIDFMMMMMFVVSVMIV